MFLFSLKRLARLTLFFTLFVACTLVPNVITSRSAVGAGNDNLIRLLQLRESTKRIKQYSDTLAYLESRYDSLAVNPFTHCFGLYQFSDIILLHNNIRYSYASFALNPSAFKRHIQDSLLVIVTSEIAQTIVTSYHSLIGRSYYGFVLNHAQLLACCHLMGTNTATYLFSNNIYSADMLYYLVFFRNHSLTAHDLITVSTFVPITILKPTVY